MKILILTLGSSLFLSTGTLFAASVWAPGVTETSGWYDVNKRSTSDYSTTDRNFCWAATASNMLQWWCDRYEEAGYSVPSTIQREGSANYNCGIFENLFLPNWDPEKGAISHVGFQWFFEGEKHTISTYSSPTGGGNYLNGETGLLDAFDSAYGAYSETWGTLRDRTGYALGTHTENYSICLDGSYYAWGSGRPQQTNTTADVFSNYLSTMLKRGPVGMGFLVGTGGGGHEITVWGCELDENQQVSSVYITDSDHSADKPLQVVLTEYIVNYSGNNVSINYNEASIFNGNQVVSLTGIMGYPIPEPSAFGLLAGLAALALAGTRRSRRKSGK